MSAPENYFDVHFDGLGPSIFRQNFEKTRFIKKETDGKVLAVSLWYMLFTKIFAYFSPWRGV